MLLRDAGCTVNDLLDRDIDVKVLSNSSTTGCFIYALDIGSNEASISADNKPFDHFLARHVHLDKFGLRWVNSIL